MKTNPLLLRLAALLLVLTLAAFSSPKLTKTTITKNLAVGVPRGFVPLPDDGIAAKYPAARRPLAVFTDPSGRIDFSVAQKPTTFNDRDYGLLLKIYKASIQNMYSKVQFLGEDIRTINKRDFIMLEFVSTVNDTRRGSNLAPIRKYQLVQYAIQGDQLFVFTFDAPADEQAQWQPTAQAVMKSIMMK
ncbi:hypothetical protein SAMN02745146_0286 [Hymenobacter daecheongensis DSM 21074]|uniref:DUF1795 domain-containing protein n=1 Tax=Hymenobacter daecheongensis DSM 21074 TaxID=1121955 RepID=A0A1M6MJ11_9BACT|nr:hypothetical protein [Hymenobacter daecheongensis]SHJ83350.1 hypothetical protein SAMN02745146_0286 [Hymenobacter daecheongensis DSM 21074]